MKRIWTASLHCYAMNSVEKMFHVEQTEASMRKSYFIINPASGKGQGLKIVTRIEENWTSAGIDFQIHITRNHGDIAVGVENACRAGATEIIIGGGDGTILAVVNALAGREVPIGIVPCGSGNDFARSNGLPLDAEQALHLLLNARQVKEIDIGKCNGIYFLNVASVGIDAAIVRRTLQIKKWIRGPLVYLVASIIEIFFYTPMRIEIDVDGRSYHRIIELAAVANGKYYGGGMKIAPLADATDGMYEVVLISQMKKQRLLRLLPTLYSGAHVREPEVEVMAGKTITLHMACRSVINLDGELTAGSVMILEEPDHKISLLVN